jgi:integrase/recombinase XerD
VTTELPLEVTEFLTWLAVERGRTPSTLEAYRRDLRRYLRWLDERRLSIGEVTESDLAAFVAAESGQRRSAATVARTTVSVRSLHRYLALEHDGRGDPGADVEAPRVPAGLPKALDEEEVARLLDGVTGDRPVDRRDRALLEVLYGTGLRVAELVGLSLGDVDLDGQLLRAFGKGRKERVVPLGRLAREALASWYDPGGRPDLYRRSGSAGPMPRPCS